MTRKRAKLASLEWSGPDQRLKPCRRRLMASVYPSKMLAFTRLRRLEELLRSGQIDDRFLWTTPALTHCLP
jgi:hypothetical protein